MAYPELNPSMLGFTQIGEERYGFKEFRYDRNGLRVVIGEDHSKPVLTYLQMVKMGPLFETTGKTGNTHFLEHMGFQGTENHNTEKGNGVVQTFKPLGFNINAYTSHDFTGYYECVSSAHIGVCVETEADRLRYLRLRPCDVASEMNVILQERDMRLDDPGEFLDQHLFAAAFMEHPYRNPIIGWESDIAATTPEGLRGFYDDGYWPNNCVIFVCGDVDTMELLALIAKHYGSIPASPKPIPVVHTVEPPQNGQRRFTLYRAGSDLARVGVAFHVPQAAHPDTYAVALLSYILGGSDNRSSRLYQRLIETNMAAGVGTAHYEKRHPLLLTVQAAVSAESTPGAVQAVLFEEVARLASEPLSDGELNRAKSAMRADMIIGLLDPLFRARLMCAAEAATDDWSWALAYSGHFAQVTAAAVQRAAALYLNERNSTVGYLLHEAVDDTVDGAQAPAVSGN